MYIYHVSLLTACKKELDIAFDSGVRDISGNGVHVEAINVTVNDGKACFNGDGALVIPRFANAEIGENLEIKVRYSLNKQFGKRKRRQALLYNGDCDFTSTMVIAVDSEEAYFGLSNDRGRFKHIAVTNTIQRVSYHVASIVWSRCRASRKQTYIMLTPLNPTFI